MEKSRVIIADRSQTLMEGIRGLLDTVFDSVVMVADVRSLIDTADKLGADMAVVDLTIGNGDFLETIRELKSRFPDLKIIVISIYDDATALEKVILSGADGFVLKRLAAEDLLPGVQAVLNGGTFASRLQKS
jgi:DNA-binding NarL/FixJ family response regulator